MALNYSVKKFQNIGHWSKIWEQGLEHILEGRTWEGTH